MPVALSSHLFRVDHFRYIILVHIAKGFSLVVVAKRDYIGDEFLNPQLPQLLKHEDRKNLENCLWACCPGNGVRCIPFLLYIYIPTLSLVPNAATKVVVVFFFSFTNPPHKKRLENIVLCFVNATRLPKPWSSFASSAIRLKTICRFRRITHLTICNSNIKRNDV